MRTLVVSAVHPYPPLSGSPMRVWHNICALATLGEVAVFSCGNRVEGVERMPHVDRWVRIDYEAYPERPFTGIGRVKKLIRPRQFPIPNDAITNELNATLRAFIREVRPDIVVLSNWANDVPDALRDVPLLVLDAHNVESQLHADMLGTQGRRLGVRARLEVERFRRRERRLVRKAVRVWACSDDDARALERLAPGMRTPVIVPNVIDVDAYASVRDRSIAAPPGIPKGPPTIVFVAYYLYVPNRVAAAELIDEIFPRVLARRPDARLILVGHQPTEKMRAAAQRDSRIIVTGSVADARPYLGVADVAAVMLRTGGGTRLKILEAFAAGVPVVTTAKGIEGIAALDGRHATIVDERDAFCHAIVDVFNDRASYQPQIDAAFNLVRDAYSLATLQHVLPSALPLHPRIATALERKTYLQTIV